MTQFAFWKEISTENRLKITKERIVIKKTNQGVRVIVQVSYGETLKGGNTNGDRDKELPLRTFQELELTQCIDYLVERAWN